MKTPHAFLRLLEVKRHRLEQSMPGYGITEAGCEVFDELMWRVRMITDHVPEDAPMSRSHLEKATHAYEILNPVIATATQLDKILLEGLEAINQRHKPFVKFLKRVESEGFLIAEELDAVTDITDWSPHEHSDAETRVTVEAEKTARAEQADLYAERVKRMADDYYGIDAEYAQRVRDLIKPIQDIVRQ